MVCWRCRKLFQMYEQYAAVQPVQNARGVAVPFRPYHFKCLPPNLRHLFPGSRPGQSAESRSAGRVAPD